MSNLHDDLNEQNFLLYAAKAYDKPNCIMSEFEEDVKHLKYVKRLFRKYKSSGRLKDRLILNHIIILSNVFGVEPATRLLFLKTDEKDWDVLKTFLLFLGYMPEVVKSINGKDIYNKNIGTDSNIESVLNKIGQ